MKGETPKAGASVSNDRESDHYRRYSTPLPSDAPLFLAFIAVHIAAGLTAVLAGAIAMLSGKQPGRRPQAGTVYYCALAAIFATMSVPAYSRWSEDYHLLILGLVFKHLGI